MNPEEAKKLQAQLNDPNAAMNKLKSNRERFNYINQRVQNIKVRDGAQAKRNRVNRIRADIKVIADRLDKNVDPLLENTQKGLINNDAGIAEYQNILTNLQAELTARQKQIRDDGPTIKAISNQINITPSKQNGDRIERIGAGYIQEYQTQLNNGYGYDLTGGSPSTGNLDPNDPGTWASLGLLRGGIPTRFIEIMNGINSSDPQKVSAAIATFDFFRNPKNEASIHVNSQLDAETKGHLTAMSKLSGLDTDAYMKV